MNDLEFASNGALTNELPPKPHERLHPDAVAESVGANFRTYERARSRNTTVLIILIFWVLYYAGISAMVAIEAPNETRNLYVPRAFVSVGGVLLSFGMVFVLDRMRSLSVRAVVAVILALTLPVLHFFINLAVFDSFFPRQTPGMPAFSEFAEDYLLRAWVFASVSGIILARSYAADIREREERIHALQALAHSAQLRALRYQLNPHFLFNALNSIAGLVSGRRPDSAERMTENLADFLRTTLSLDPQKVITLDEELRLQNLYLDIEKVRFPERLSVKVDVPDRLRSALVPGLITQPLIENSIKYAVARSTEPVRLSIEAQSDGDVLELVVADDGGNATAGKPKGARMGLANVAERLKAHFGDSARFETGPRSGGGFVNRIVMPLRWK
jgi:sensor histidine kinase YesM